MLVQGNQLTVCYKSNHSSEHKNFGEKKNCVCPVNLTISQYLKTFPMTFQGNVSEHAFYVLDKEMCQPLENVCNSVNQFLK